MTSGTEVVAKHADGVVPCPCKDKHCVRSCRTLFDTLLYCSTHHPETWQKQYKCADGYINTATGALEYRLTDAVETVPVPVKVCWCMWLANQQNLAVKPLQYVLQVDHPAFYQNLQQILADEPVISRWDDDKVNYLKQDSFRKATKDLQADVLAYGKQEGDSVCICIGCHTVIIIVVIIIHINSIHLCWVTCSGFCAGIVFVLGDFDIDAAVGKSRVDFRLYPCPENCTLKKVNRPGFTIQHMVKKHPVDIQDKCIVALALHVSSSGVPVYRPSSYSFPGQTGFYVTPDGIVHPVDGVSVTPSEAQEAASEPRRGKVVRSRPTAKPQQLPQQQAERRSNSKRGKASAEGQAKRAKSQLQQPTSSHHQELTELRHQVALAEKSQEVEKEKADRRVAEEKLSGQGALHSAKISSMEKLNAKQVELAVALEKVDSQKREKEFIAKQNETWFSIMSSTVAGASSSTLHIPSAQQDGEDVSQQEMQAIAAREKLLTQQRQ